jgi:TetR/AcrR family transcriptional repressor of nem operon
MTLSTTKIEILNAAQNIIQLRGYNGFSFADISQTVGIRKASIHHHFSSKSALGLAVIRRYREEFNRFLDEANFKGSTWIEKIHNYAKLYENTLLQNKLCLCGMLASDIETLPKILKKELRAFFNDNVIWIENVIKVQFKSMPDKHLQKIAWHIISSLQGGIMLARMQGQKEIFSSIWDSLSLYLKNLR